MSPQPSIHEITWENLPYRLKEIPDPPNSLYVRGAEIEEERPTLAVVGSRKMSEYGRRACEKLVAGLADYDIQIVSGLAYGIDSVALRSALKAGIRTIAVPGSGINDRVLYPRAHLSLAHEILTTSGTLISEFEPSQRADKWTFPQRNRIMAGLSDATLLVEAAERSGSLITARLSLEYNREVLVVPGEIFSKTSRGTNDLLRDGATPILESSDIAHALDLPLRKVSEPRQQKQESKLLSLFDDKIERDELLQLSGNSRETQIELSKLEIEGVIEIQNGTVYKKIR